MKKALLLSAALVLASQAAYPAARLTYMIDGKPVPIAWSEGSFPLSYEIDRGAASGLRGGAASVTRAFDAWASIQGSAVAFRSSGVKSAPAGKDGRNSISISGDLFAESGFIAYTTTWFDDSGTIREADIQVDAGSAADPNVSGIVEHEIGHLLGLDHSGILSSVMYPFVRGNSPLESDDMLAIAALYPQEGPETGTLRGTVYGIDGAVFAAQVVAVDDSGAPTAGVLTDASGDFELNLPPGDYRVYAEPLDGPVDVRNFSGIWRDARDLDFRTEFYRGSGPVRIAAGQVTSGITLRGDGLATLNPQWIGTFQPGSGDVTLMSMTANVTPGETISIGVGGSGIIPGVTEFEIGSSDLTRISDFDYGANYVWATFRISPTAAPRSLVILVSNGSDEAALTGALRILPAPSRRRAIQ